MRGAVRSRVTRVRGCGSGGLSRSVGQVLGARTRTGARETGEKPLQRDHRSPKLGDSRAPIAGLQRQNLETRRVRALRSAPPPLAAAHLLVLGLELVVVRREGARPRATAGALGGGAAGVRAPRVAGGEGGRSPQSAQASRWR